MTAMLDAVSAVVTSAIGWIGQFCTAITSNPIMVLGVVAVPLCGLAVGLIGRLLRKRV